jgi:hypothetical protein
MKPTKLVKAAFEEVRKYFPNINVVFYGTDGRWLYCEGTVPVDFGDFPIDISLLEEAADSVKKTPVLFLIIS